MDANAKPILKADVLICEDDAMNRDLIVTRLAKLGISPATAKNGQEGLDIVTRRQMNGEKPFDLILMDINMPVMDGLEAATKIRKLNTGVPVIAMTPNCALPEREKYQAHGMVDCLCKPFTLQELQDCLLKYMPAANQNI